MSNDGHSSIVLIEIMAIIMMTIIIRFTECLLCARHCSQLGEEGIIISSILPMEKLSYEEVT